jgi:POT family proton-dependent oligopeptide transporter
MTNLRSSIVPALSVHTPLLTNHALTVGEEQDAEDTLTANNDSTASLRRVADSLPLSVWIIAIIELCERFAFFGIIGPMQNYLQNSSDDVLRPGGIGIFPHLT